MWDSECIQLQSISSYNESRPETETLYSGLNEVDADEASA